MQLCQRHFCENRSMYDFAYKSWIKWVSPHYGVGSSHITFLFRGTSSLLNISLLCYPVILVMPSGCIGIENQMALRNPTVYPRRFQQPKLNGGSHKGTSFGDLILDLKSRGSVHIHRIKKWQPKCQLYLPWHGRLFNESS